MGFENRDYAYNPEPGLHLQAPKSVVNHEVDFC